jgi:hypothetical protein
MIKINQIFIYNKGLTHTHLFNMYLIKLRRMGVLIKF